jgi:hypothetical protein
LNFDGVAKGNLGRTGLGGVIGDSKGNIIQLYTGSLGNSTNNVAEFRALETGLEISQLGGDDELHSGRRLYASHQHSEKTPKRYPNRQDPKALAIGLHTEQNPGALANKDQCVVVMGEEVSKWTDIQNNEQGGRETRSRTRHNLEQHPARSILSILHPTCGKRLG